MSDDSIILRSATVDDADEILSIYSYYVKNTAITFEITVPSIEIFKKRIENTLKRFPYIVAELDGKIAGYCYASPLKEREAYKHSTELSIYVDANLRRKGIGRKLLEELEKQLLERGILNSYACIAKPAVEDEYLTFDSINFHGRMGYKQNGEFTRCARKFDRWYNMVWMEKFLG